MSETIETTFGELQDGDWIYHGLELIRFDDMGIVPGRPDMGMLFISWHEGGNNFHPAHGHIVFLDDTVTVARGE